MLTHHTENRETGADGALVPYGEYGAKGFFWKLFMCVLLLLAVIRMFNIAMWITRTSYQMDFSAYYTAAESVNRGLSPYDNNIVASPPCWDGVAAYRSSRFLYPPLVAILFKPLTILNYSTAKRLWTIWNLASVGMCVFLTCLALDKHRNVGLLLASGIAAYTFFPVLTLLERGQIDGLTSVLLAAAFWCIMESRPRWAGIHLSLATLFKLHIIYAMPFLVIRRQWKVLAAYCVGGTSLLAVTIMTAGPSATWEYVWVHLPRISAYGWAAPDTLRLRKYDWDRAAQNGLDDYMRGKFSNLSSDSVLDFSPHHGSLCLTKAGERFLNVLSGSFLGDRGKLSLLIFSLMGAMYFGGTRKPMKDSTSGGNRVINLLYWQGVLLIVLLSAPYTWTMNVVWMIPLFPILITLYPSVRSKQQRFSFFLCSAGFLLAWAPDKNAISTMFHLKLAADVAWLFSEKYVLSEILCLIGIVGLIRASVQGGASRVNAGFAGGRGLRKGAFG